ncbi:MAG: UDP-N-acetylmuramoyl-L-alanyl-D-glutamate--2,6-diaminopimelate ligase, partial [Planctomycetes bacterium]|nr:UDP-N-acetylmuramoyl-L-alanyl-D-glutamate--2,6-diaminopimelate ligase [Planctomycetota bacterium]
FGVHAEADVTATVIECCGSEQTFLLAAGNETVAVRTRMIGNHHVSNCLAAAAAALVLGVDLQAIARGLESLERIPGRLEPVDCGQSFGVFVDSAHTPDSLAVSLKALRQVTSGRLICVFGASGERDPNYRPLLGRIAERTADVSIITTDNPGHEDVLAIAHDIMDGYDRPARARLIPNRTKAIQWAVESAQPGDTVLIAGKGHEQFQIIGHTTTPFDDREVAKHHLYRLSAENRPISGLHLLSFADHAA